MFSKLTAALSLAALFSAPSDAALFTKCSAAKTIALTFDDAFQYPAVTNLLADLKTYGIKATFFIVPSTDSNFCTTLKTILAAGHAIENHGKTHTHPNSWSSAQLTTELKGVESAVTACGISTKMTEFRPPYLEANSTTVSLAAAAGYATVTSNVDSKDYNGINLATAWTNVQSGITAAGGSAIVLGHNWCYTSSGTQGIIKKYSDTYKSQGYSFVTVKTCIGV